MPLAGWKAIDCVNYQQTMSGSDVVYVVVKSLPIARRSSVRSGGSSMEKNQKSLSVRFFERGGLRAIFDHARNAVVATLFIAAGLDASRRAHDLGIFGFLNPAIAGYCVAGVGCILIVLNFIDGLRKLKKLQWNFMLQVGFSLAYLIASIRIAQLIVMLRTH